MTTQVVLTNGLGIALASDSAVTAGGKVLNTSEKIFELPAPHKAAVLTSGRARFMGIPWEVVFSAWSESLDRPLASMVEYRESLYKFLRTVIPSTGRLSSSEGEFIRSSYFGDRNAYDTVWKILSDTVLPHFESILDENDLPIFTGSEGWDEEFRSRMSELVPTEVISTFEQQLELAMQARRERFAPATEITEAQALVWLEKYWAQIENTPSNMDFSTWPMMPGFDSAVKRLHATFLVHSEYDGESNINIFGFGAGELFPSGAGGFLLGVINGTLVRRFEGVAESSSEPRDYFFGQDDAIAALTRGEDHLLTNAAVEKTQRTLTDIYDRLSDSDDESAKLARDYVKQSIDKGDLAEEMKRAGSEERGKPFRKAIGMSPILDLAEFASQLVGVQAAYAAMTQENPSVGGFVDVAIITHRRGFEWIRHKH
jgi:hypothetical protein